MINEDDFFSLTYSSHRWYPIFPVIWSSLFEVLLYLLTVLPLINLSMSISGSPYAALRSHLSLHISWGKRPSISQTSLNNLFSIISLVLESSFSTLSHWAIFFFYRSFELLMLLVRPQLKSYGTPLSAVLFALSSEISFEFVAVIILISYNCI